MGGSKTNVIEEGFAVFGETGWGEDLAWAMAMFILVWGWISWLTGQVHTRA